MQPISFILKHNDQSARADFRVEQDQLPLQLSFHRAHGLFIILSFGVVMLLGGLAGGLVAFYDEGMQAGGKILLSALFPLLGLMALFWGFWRRSFSMTVDYRPGGVHLHRSEWFAPDIDRFVPFDSYEAVVTHHAYDDANSPHGVRYQYVVLMHKDNPRLNVPLLKQRGYEKPKAFLRSWAAFTGLPALVLMQRRLYRDGEEPQRASAAGLKTAVSGSK